MHRGKRRNTTYREFSCIFSGSNLYECIEAPSIVPFRAYLVVLTVKYTVESPLFPFNFAIESYGSSLYCAGGVMKGVKPADGRSSAGAEE